MSATRIASGFFGSIFFSEYTRWMASGRSMQQVRPYTFIFEATQEVPKIMLRKRRTIGIRMPDHPVARMLLAGLDQPLLSTSIRNPDDDFVNDPLEIDATYGDRIDVVIDCGPLLPVPSTVVDLSSGQPVLVREGKGDVDALEMFE